MIVPRPPTIAQVSGATSSLRMVHAGRSPHCLPLPNESDETLVGRLQAVHGLAMTRTQLEDRSAA